MAGYLVFEYDLRVLEQQDRGGDEPHIQIAFISQNEDNSAEVRVVDEGRLASSVDAGDDAIRRQVDVPNNPTDERPFFAFAVRALEEDNSRTSDRDSDRVAFADRIREAIDPVMRAGDVPHINLLWLAANGAPVHDNFGDDDDKIGVSARIYPELGVGLKDVIGDVVAHDRLRFIENGADWTLNFRVRSV